MYIAGMDYSLLDSNIAKKVIASVLSYALTLKNNEKYQINTIQKVFVDILIVRKVKRMNNSEKCQSILIKNIINSATISPELEKAVEYSNEYNDDSNLCRLLVMADEVFKERRKIFDSVNNNETEITNIFMDYFKDKEEKENPEIDPEVAAEVDRMTKEIEEKNKAGSD